MKKFKTLFDLVYTIAGKYDENWRTVARMVNDALPEDVPLVYNDSLKNAIETVIAYAQNELKRHNEDYEPVCCWYEDKYADHLINSIKNLKNLLEFLKNDNLDKYDHKPEYVMINNIIFY